MCVEPGTNTQSVPTAGSTVMMRLRLMEVIEQSLT